MQRSMTDPELITPVILCGGSGTRLWPLSRRSYPKQFSDLVGGESLFQASLRRVGGAGFAPPVIVTASEFRFIATQQMAETGMDPAAILLEPEPRNTAPAILAAVLRIAEAAPEGLVLITPSDHVVRDVPAFHAAIATGAEAAAEGRIVTFGIRPDRPETGYGYLELDATGDGPIPLRRFRREARPRQCRGDAGRWPLPVERGPVPCAGGCADRGLPRACARCVRPGPPRAGRGAAGFSAFCGWRRGPGPRPRISRSTTR